MPTRFVFQTAAQLRTAPTLTIPHSSDTIIILLNSAEPRVSSANLDNLAPISGAKSGELANFRTKRFAVELRQR